MKRSVNGSSSRRRSGSERRMSDRQVLPTSVPLWIAVPTIGDSPSLIVQAAGDPPGSLLEGVLFMVSEMRGEYGRFQSSNKRSFTCDQSPVASVRLPPSERAVRADFLCWRSGAGQDSSFW